ncbi:unnamed protein product [marine sediment metagenome]|uniref:Uncharacterized protein n=1 Tax=marine sediment metagenome TaxID=412755 RepID=X1NMQ6_9ZZZZ
MFGYFYKGLQLMGITQSWSEKALEDGKVTLKEATELATRFCEVLGIPLEIEIPKGKKKEE